MSDEEDELTSKRAPTFGSTVTILFSDIRGFTEYTDAHGDEASYRMLQHHNGIMQEQIALYGGHVVKTQGDSFMVAFESARQAVTCAIGIQKALAHFNESEQGAKVEVGIGINTGEPVREEGDFFGTTVNLASRICSVADPGQILISETVRALIGKMEGTNYLDQGLFELKGFQEQQRLFEIDWSGLAGSQPQERRAVSALPSDAKGHRVSTEKSRARWPYAAGAGAAVIVIAAAAFFMVQGRAAGTSAAGRPGAQTSRPPAALAAASGSRQGAGSSTGTRAELIGLTPSGTCAAGNAAFEAAIQLAGFTANSPISMDIKADVQRCGGLRGQVNRDGVKLGASFDDSGNRLIRMPPPNLANNFGSWNLCFSDEAGKKACVSFTAPLPAS